MSPFTMLDIYCLLHGWMIGCWKYITPVSAFVFTHLSVSFNQYHSPCISYSILFFCKPISHPPSVLSPLHILYSTCHPVILSSCTSYPSITAWTGQLVVTVRWALHFNTNSHWTLSKMVPFRSTHGMLKLQSDLTSGESSCDRNVYGESLWFRVLGFLF